MNDRALGLLLGYVADLILADPRRGHPVAGFGRVAGRLERLLYADARAPGAALALVGVGGCAVLGRIAETRSAPGLARVLVTAAATWVVLGGTSLDREAAAVQRLLDDGDLHRARERITHLVGRDPSSLDGDGIARAVLESVAENTSDAVVAPLVWGALAGVPGLLGYRAANTLDAMVGHRSSRYERFGWASARLDDLLNLPGSRLSAVLAASLSDDPRGALRAWRRDAAAHPSPNAGPVEAAFAGGLGVRLGDAPSTRTPCSTARCSATAVRSPWPTSPGPAPSRVGSTWPRCWSARGSRPRGPAGHDQPDGGVRAAVHRPAGARRRGRAGRRTDARDR